MHEPIHWTHSSLCKTHHRALHSRVYGLMGRGMTPAFENERLRESGLNLMYSKFPKVPCLAFNDSLSIHTISVHLSHTLLHTCVPSHICRALHSALIHAGQTMPPPRALSRARARRTHGPETIEKAWETSVPTRGVVFFLKNYRGVSWRLRRASPPHCWTS